MLVQPHRRGDLRERVGAALQPGAEDDPGHRGTSWKLS